MDITRGLVPCPQPLGKPLPILATAPAGTTFMKVSPPPPAQTKNTPLSLSSLLIPRIPVNTARVSPCVRGQLLNLAISPTPSSHSAAARALGDLTQKPRQSLARWGTVRSQERAVQGCVGRYRPSVQPLRGHCRWHTQHAWSSSSGLGVHSSLLYILLMLGSFPGKSWWVTELIPKHHWGSTGNKANPSPASSQASDQEHPNAAALQPQTFSVAPSHFPGWEGPQKGQTNKSGQLGTSSNAAAYQPSGWPGKCTERKISWVLLWEILRERKRGCDVLFLTLVQSRSRFVTFDSSPDFKDN